jgi:hypothetical protein
MKNNKKLLKTIGLILVAGIIIITWWTGWFSFIFYLLGLYTAVYIVSYLFKTTSVISFMLSVGGILLYAVSGIIFLYLLYIVLSMIFNGGFVLGLIIFFLLSIFGGLLQLIPISIGLILGYPLIFMLEDLEKKFALNNHIETEYKEIIEIDSEKNISSDK